MSRITLAFALSLSLLACSTASGPSSDERSSSTSEEALTTVPPGPNKVYGIDVSHFQGAVDWSAEKAKGRLFGVASVGDGLYQDPNFAANWAGMKAAGVIRGAYQFFEPGTDAVQQADILIAKVGKLGDGDLPATIDVEVTGGQSAATIAARVGQWLARVEAGTGKKPMIYTGPYFWQDHVASTAYGSYPLWIADYGVTSPQVPAPWSTFKIWQYSDSGGSLDLDLFDGTLAELKVFAGGPTNAPPHGVLDAATCTGITGWAQDPSAPTKAIGVHLSFDGAPGAAGAELLPIVASESRTDLCAPLGSCNHAFTVPAPVGLRDGKAHQVFAVAIDSAGGASAALAKAPQSFTCAPPEPPLTAPNGVKRAVASPAVLAAWKLSTLTDVAHYDEARVEAYPTGDAFPAKPSVLVGDDGAPEVWLVDGGKRRHVVSPASMTAWHFPAPTRTPAATLAAMARGPDWRATPFLVRGSAPTVYVLDLAPTTPPGTEAPSAPASNAPTASPPGDDPSAGAPPAGGSGGCQILPARLSGSASLGSALLFLAGALAAGARRRARHAARAAAPGRTVLAAAGLALLVAACSAEPASPTEDGDAVASSAEALTTTDAVARAEQWANAKLHYCQAPNHGRDYDSACSMYCNRTSNAAWDPYRSDCSGLISWAWALPAPGRVTTQFAPFQTDITHAIAATALRAGDAVNNSEHVMLFKEWLVQDKRALFIEEPGCSSAQPYAHETTSDVTISGSSIHVAYNGMTFTAIRYGALAVARPPAPVDHPAHGTLDGATCDLLRGWAQDVDAPTKALDVLLTFDAAAGKPGAIPVHVSASATRPDLCKALGSCNHAFDLAMPLGARDGTPHAIFAYGTDDTGKTTALLANAPKTLTCAPPAFSLDAKQAVKRAIPTPKVLAAWSFDAFRDVAREPGASADGYVKGPDMPTSPVAVQADDGSPSVWVIDGAIKRHVVDPASLAAWRLTVTRQPASKLAALAEGPPWPNVPFVFMIAGQAAVYVLDDVAVPAGAGGDPALGPAADGPAAAAAAPSGAAPEANGGGGCSVAYGSRGSSAPLLALAALAALVLGRRRRAR